MASSRVEAYTKPSIAGPSAEKKLTKAADTEGSAKEKTDFFDLRNDAVSSCWEKILTFTLVQEEPISVTNLPWASGYGESPHVVPVHVNFIPHMSEIGNKIYFSENTFHFSCGSTIERWTFYNKDAAKLLRKIGVDCDGDLPRIVDGIKRCTGLQELSIGVNEVKMIRAMCQPSKGFRNVALRPQDITPQLNLLVLRTKGMDDLRQVRVAKVKFTALIYGRNTDRTVTKLMNSAICSGVLSKVVAKEMMGPKKEVLALIKTKREILMDSDDEHNPVDHITKCAQVMSGTLTTLSRAAKARKNALLGSTPEPDCYIFNLPAELRNKIYHYVLVHASTINPSKRTPTTRHRAGTNIAWGKLYPSRAAPSSCLALLQTNKQIYKEAMGIFYSENVFVFYYPNQMMMFLQTLSRGRKQYIKHVSMWYDTTSQGDIDSIDVYLSALKNLKSLKHLEIVLDQATTWILARLPLSDDESRFPGEAMMKELADGGLHIKVRSQSVDTFFWARKQDPTFESTLVQNYEDQRMAIRSLRERIKKPVEEHVETA